MMYKFRYFYCILLLNFPCISATCQDYDLTVVGFLNPSDGLGRIPLTIMHGLKKYIHVNWIETKPWHTNINQLPEWAQKIAQDSCKKPGKVAILTDMLLDSSADAFSKVPDDSLIKIAYSMIESTRIPTQWTAILNQRFDAVVVPDAFHIKTYQDSGVKIPIFVLPPILYLEKQLSEEPQTHPHYPFVFGNTSASRPHKNQELLIQAFYKAFGDSPDVKLIINARAGDPEIHNRIQNMIKEFGVHNIEYQMQTKDWQDYVHQMASFDCYINLSKGEGFDIPPREASALGIPIILSKNSAHQTICKTGLASCIPSKIREPAPYAIYYQTCGSFFNSSLDDAVAALQDMYKNYHIHYKKALLRKQWASQYLLKNLLKKYLNLVRPLKIILGTENLITDDFIMTTSKPLYLKYRLLSGQ